jgi:hypothetical protein
MAMAGVEVWNLVELLLKINDEKMKNKIAKELLNIRNI